MSHDPKSHFSFKTIGDSASLSKYFNELSTCLKNKRITFKSEDSQISVTPDGPVELELYAEQKKNKEKLILELSWKLKEEPSEQVNLQINSQKIENSTIDDMTVVTNEPIEKSKTTVK